VTLGSGTAQASFGGNGAQKKKSALAR
jgi:hypothetical protein